MKKSLVLVLTGKWTQKRQTKTESSIHSNNRHRSIIRYLSKKKFANFNEFSEIKKIRKNSYKNSLNARVGVAFQ